MDVLLLFVKLLAYLLTPRSRNLPEKLAGSQLLKKHQFVEPEGSLPHSQEPAAPVRILK
jgi:hypothetical protein